MLDNGVDAVQRLHMAVAQVVEDHDGDTGTEELEDGVRPDVAAATRDQRDGVITTGIAGGGLGWGRYDGDCSRGGGHWC